MRISYSFHYIVLVDFFFSSFCTYYFVSIFLVACVICYLYTKASLDLMCTMLSFLNGFSNNNYFWCHKVSFTITHLHKSLQQQFANLRVWLPGLVIRQVLEVKGQAVIFFLSEGVRASKRQQQPASYLNVLPKKPCMTCCQRRVNENAFLSTKLLDFII